MYTYIHFLALALDASGEVSEGTINSKTALMPATPADYEDCGRDDPVVD